MDEGSDRPLTVITGDRKTRERRAGRRRALDQNHLLAFARMTQASRPAWRCA